MKSTLLIATLLLFAGPALASEKLLGTITSAGSSTTNASTAVAFTLPKGGALLTIQCTVDVWFLPGTGALSVTSATGLRLLQWEKFPTSLKVGEDVIAILPASGSGACTVWQRDGNEGC